MPLNITAETVRVTRTIAGFSVSVPAPYYEGHPLTEGEAKQMNQVLAENISNNLRKRLDDGHMIEENGESIQAAFTPEEAQAEVDNYIATYEPGVRGAGSGEPRITDPVEREARKIAKMKAVELVKAHGMKAKDVDLSAITDQIFEANQELLMKEGAKIVKALEAAKTSGDKMEIAGISLVPANGAAEEAAAAEEA